MFFGSEIIGWVEVSDGLGLESNSLFDCINYGSSPSSKSSPVKIDLVEVPITDSFGSLNPSRQMNISLEELS